MAEVIVLELPEDVELPDLQSFFRGYAAKGKFSINEQKYVNGSPCRYGIVDFDLPKHAEKAIRKFNGKKLMGVPVTVRQYHYRSYQNERRAVNWRTLPWNGPERRKIERRKKLASAVNNEQDMLSGILAVETDMAF